MPTGNHLLDALPRKVFRAHERSLEPVALELKQILHRPDRNIDYAYFPIRGVISMVNEPNRGEIVEIATIGREGMAGLPVILDAGSMTARTLVQVPGDGFRMKAAALRKLIESSSASRELMLRYTMALFTQTAQITSCNRLHEVQQRCARWLLQTHDRADSESFPLTQEFLAQMLGVHRPSVSIAADMLQRRGLINIPAASSPSATARASRRPHVAATALSPRNTSASSAPRGDGIAHRASSNEPPRF